MTHAEQVLIERVLGAYLSGVGRRTDPLTRASIVTPEYALQMQKLRTLARGLMLLVEMDHALVDQMRDGSPFAVGVSAAPITSLGGICDGPSRCYGAVERPLLSRSGGQPHRSSPAGAPAPTDVEVRMRESIAWTLWPFSGLKDDGINRAPGPCIVRDMVSMEIKRVEPPLPPPQPLEFISRRRRWKPVKSEPGVSPP